MEASNKKVKYPENLPLRDSIKESGKSISFLAGKLNISRVVLSNLVNGHYKGNNIVPRLKTLLNQ
ncbi:hypothetical protein J3L18_23040 [Mucilaginibacter gossypii]|uniref:hypothetical protein n=1 Tax=Mucilaginibacter gossypii TaxID=551996 RepID=UPI000DCB5B8C|nr:MULTISPECIES: hypothetical protein [Mucilaginibacter]QTE35992.1 hypothetical protein J3L18_23040 [Mucilaginibacter gossypii]RAV56665.1 hypothetical protein DIU36_14790 [Mucilaginibacter rubeus]